MQQQTDVLIIGSGIAGLMCALELPTHLSVLILAKKTISEGSSFYAQGGMSVAINDIEAHIQDTMLAADGLADEVVVRFMVQNSTKALESLEDYGVCWSKYKGQYHLVQEGAHHTARIVHIADHTGKSMHTALMQQVTKRSNITILTAHIAVDLLVSSGTCGGAYVLDNQQQMQTIIAKNTVLATGGSSKVYKYTSNPDTSTGDGLAMAYRIGAKVKNMEFSQFHPTCLYHPYAKSFLISEALRGEGAKLLLPTGEEFMHKYDKRGELASRDVVARAIDNEMKIEGFECVYLDISFQKNKFIKQRFPTIFNKCLEFNIDITKDKIPVVPAAHYSCGGVVTNLDGLTNIKGLYAVGEVACTGVHGANRLASNSLLECVVFASSTAKHIINNTSQQFMQFNDWDEKRVVASKEKVFVRHLWDEVRLIMWNYVGIVRSCSRLHYAQQKLAQIQIEVNEYYKNYLISNDLVELRNLILCAQVIIDSSIKRKKNCGLYYNTDYKQ